MTNGKLYCEKNALLQGGILILIGAFMPLILREDFFRIYETMQNTLFQEDPFLLLLTSLKLVLMNCVRAIPHYLGAFIISDSLRVTYKGKRRFVCNIIVAFILVALVYFVIDRFYFIRYDFGMPALLLISCILFLSYLDLFSVDMVNRIIILSSLLLSLQWLDVIPGLSQYGFGGGEISRDIKMVAHFLEYDELLGFFALCMCGTFFFCTAIQVQLLYKEHKLRLATMRRREVETELHNTQFQALRLRSYSEVQSLVHDLKTPLTTVQGLVNLAEMMEQDAQIREYLGKISGSVTVINSMISEILYENRKNELTTDELIRTVRSQLSITALSKLVEYVNECRDARILANRIRLSRAIINTIENAYQAVSKETGHIQVHIFHENGLVMIQISDNGTGIAPDQLESIWEPGVSGHDSTGLGLGFTRQVVENHGGSIEIESREGEYTKVTMFLKELFSAENSDAEIKKGR